MKQRLACLLLFLWPCLWHSANALAVTEGKPQRIVSLTTCTDQMLLMLVGHERIAALSNLSTDPLYSYHWQQAQGLTTHSGLAEQIIPLQPDLIIGSRFTSGNSVQILQQLGYQVKTFDSPTTLQEAADYTRAIAQIVGEPDKAEDIIDAMRSDITRAKNLVADQPQQLAISYGPNGFTAGTHTLKHEILAAAGYRNLASELGIDYYGNVSLEQLIWSNPDAIIIDEDIPDQNSLAQSFVKHPVLDKLMRDRTLPSVPTNQWICPGPLAAKAILTLAEQRQ